MSKRKIQSSGDQKLKSTKLLFDRTDNFVDKLVNTNESNDVSLELKTAWIDEDDRQSSSKTKLKQKYETLMGTPGWAKLKDKADQPENESEILRTVGHLQKSKSKELQKEFLNLKRLKQINTSTHTEGPIISCIEFHSKASVALVAGTSGLVTLFSIGDKCNKLHNFKLKGWSQVMTTDILPDGSEAYISSSKSHQFCVYDLMKAQPKFTELPKNFSTPTDFKLSSDGKYIATCEGFEEVYLLCTGSYELLRCLKHNDKVVSVTFSHNNKQLYTMTCSGEITVWDLTTYRSMKKFYDNGCVNASCITSSGCGRLLATGSNEGIVNIYQVSEIINKEPMPHKTITNLRTAITHLKFNPTTEILSVASKMYPNAAKLVHIPSYHVFKNFPEHNHNLNNVVTMSFSPNCGYMALGNDNGSALLYRLRHYKNY